mmetsp:Transcript_26793/g.72333  ORF Transcript_26793/g.72333 Transcript_26793/m.72333 type:complete len:411 (-) Transcript_26793:4067-5299(-)
MPSALAHGAQGIAQACTFICLLLLLLLHHSGDAEAVHDEPGCLLHLRLIGLQLAPPGQAAQQAFFKGFLLLRIFLFLLGSILQALQQHQLQVLLIQVLIHDRQQLQAGLRLLLVLHILLAHSPLLQHRLHLGVCYVVWPDQAHDGVQLLPAQLVQLSVDAHSLMRLLLHLREGVDNDGEQEVQQHHEHQQHVGPEEEGASDGLEPTQVPQLLVHTDLPQQDLKAGVDRVVEGLKLLDGVAKDEVGEHGVAHKHHEEHECKVDEIRTRQPQGAGDHTQAGLEVHELEHAHHEQQDVDATKRKVQVKGLDDVNEACEVRPQVHHVATVATQGQVVGLGHQGLVHIVPQLQVKSALVPNHKVPPDADAGRQQAVGDELRPIPAGEEELQKVALAPLGLHNLPQILQHHDVDPG